MVFFLIFFILPISIFAQDNYDLIRALNPDSAQQSNPNPVDPDKANAISETQKKLLRKVIDNLSDREIDEYLFRLGLSTSGSVYAKRIRLRDAIGPDPGEKVKDQFANPNADKKKSAPFIIENASEGELLSIDKTKSGVLILKGKVKLKLGEGTLTAELVSVDSKKGEIYAEGGIFYKSGPLEIKGDKFIFDVGLERGVVYDTKASMYPTNFVGQKIKKVDENKYLLELGYFTACNAEVPHYTFKASKVFIYEDKSVVATNMWFSVAGTKLFYMPLYYGSNLGSGWTFQYGQNRTQGKFLQTSYQWSEPLAVPTLLSPVGRKIKLDSYEKTGTHLGFEFWKVSPWLNYNIDLGVADAKQYQFAAKYHDYMGDRNNDMFSKFNPKGSDIVVTTNEIDKGEKCLEFKGKCVDTYSNIASKAGLGTYSYRDIGERHQTWWKGNVLANAKSNNIGADGTRNVQVRLEAFTNPKFDYEYGFRYQPANTLQSLYTNRTQRNPLVRMNPVWSTDYAETRGDLSVNISVKRLWTYYYLTPSDKSNFFPIRDELPRVQIKNSSLLGKVPYIEAPIYWDFSMNNLVARSFGPPVQKPLIGSLPPPEASISDPYGKYRENLFRTEYFTRIETGIRSSMNFGSYINFAPGIYFGTNKQSVERADTATAETPADISIARFYKRESYKFLKQNHKISFGIPAFLLSSTYRRTDARNRELQDTVLKDGRDAVHEAEVAIESNSFEDFEFSIRTIRDLRQFSDNYKPQPTDAQRWYYTVFRIGGFYDFYNGFGKKRETLLERQRSFFSGVFINNDYVYHTSQHRPLYNSASAGYQMGGFSFLFFKNIKSLEAGGSWYHVYNNFMSQSLGTYALPGTLQQSFNSNTAYVQSNTYNGYYTNTSSFQDMYRVYIKADLQFTRNLGLELDLDSRVTQPWRYTNQVGDNAFYRNGQDPYTISGYSSSSIYQPTSLAKDVGNGLQFGSDKSKNTAFNINRLMWVIKYNVHDFEYRLGYSMDLRAIPGGPSFDSQVTFYDQTVFFAVNLLNITLGPEDTASQQTRARLYRYRKRPLDAGYSTSVTGQ